MQRLQAARGCHVVISGHALLQVQAQGSVLAPSATSWRVDDADVYGRSLPRVALGAGAAPRAGAFVGQDSTARLVNPQGGAPPGTGLGSMRGAACSTQGPDAQERSGDGCDGGQWAQEYTFLVQPGTLLSDDCTKVGMRLKNRRTWTAGCSCTYGYNTDGG
jgi:hypothetical protein